MKVNDIDASFWELAGDFPELREALIKAGSEGLYSIPVRKWEIEHPADKLPTGHTISWELLKMEDPDKREKAIQNIRKIENMTVGQLATLANYASTEYEIREASGQELSPVEQTIKDIDITLLAYYIVRLAPKRIGYRNGQGLTPEEFHKAWKEATGSKE